MGQWAIDTISPLDARTGDLNTMVAQAKAVDEDSNGDGRLGKTSDPKSSEDDNDLWSTS